MFLNSLSIQSQGFFFLFLVFKIGYIFSTQSRYGN